VNLAKNLLVLTALLLASGCSGSEGNDRFRGDGMYETFGESAAVFGASQCLYIQRCHQPNLPLSLCIDDYVNDICRTFECDLPPLASNAEVDACFDASEALECDGQIQLALECEFAIHEEQTRRPDPDA
jgi:hypothetical protein